MRSHGFYLILDTVSCDLICFICIQFDVPNYYIRKIDVINKALKFQKIIVHYIIQ